MKEESRETHASRVLGRQGQNSESGLVSFLAEKHTWRLLGGQTACSVWISWAKSHGQPDVEILSGNFQCPRNRKKLHPVVPWGGGQALGGWEEATITFL